MPTINNKKSKKITGRLINKLLSDKESNTMYGSYYTIAKGESDLDASAHIRVSTDNDLASILGISPWNRMSGVLDIAPPPSKTFKFYPVQDSYTKDTTPTMNYGSSASLYAGPYLGNNYRTYLQFDLTDVIEEIKAESVSVEKINFKYATLKLKIMWAYVPAITFGLYEIKDNWPENGITWRNQPQPTKLHKTFETVPGNSTIEIDILDILLYYLENDITSPSFMIVPMESAEGHCVYLSSRSGTAIPEIAVSYYDPTPVLNYRESTLQSNLFVIGNGISLLPSSLEIMRHDDHIYLPSTIFVSTPDIIECDVAVSRRYLMGQVNVRQKDWNDFSSIIVSRRSFMTEIDTSVFISRRYLNSTLQIAGYNNFPAYIPVRRNTWQGFEARMHISNMFVRAHLNIRTFDSLSSNVVVRTANDFNSQLLVRKPGEKDLPTTIVVRTKTDVPGHLIVTKYSSIQGSVTSRVADSISLHSAIISRLNEEHDFPSQVIIRKNTELDIESQIIVSRRLLKSSVVSRLTTDIDLESSLLVRRNTFYDLPLIVSPSRLHLFANLRVVYLNVPNDIGATVKIRKNTDIDLESVITIRGSSDFDSRIVVRHSKSNDINAQALVMLVNDFPSSVSVTKKVISGSLVVRQAADMENTIVVRTMADLSGSLRVYGLVDLDLPASMISRVMGYSEIQSTLFALKWSQSSLPSMIWIADERDLTCTLIVPSNKGYAFIL